MVFKTGTAKEDLKDWKLNNIIHPYQQTIKKKKDIWSPQSVQNEN